MKKYFPWIVVGIVLLIIPMIFVLASYHQWAKRPVTVERLIATQSTVTYNHTATPDGVVDQPTEFQFFKNFIYVDGAQENGHWSGSTFTSDIGKFEFMNNQVNVTWYDGTEWVYYNK